MLAELSAVFPEVDRAVQADLNAIAVAVRDWRKSQLEQRPIQRSIRNNLH